MKGDYAMTVMEQLAMIYVEKKATSSSTPEELLSLFRDAYAEIKCSNERDYSKPLPQE